MTTVPAQSFSAPARAASMAASRCIPGVCGVFESSSPACTTRTPCSRQSGCSGMRSAYLRQPPLEQAPLGVIGRQLDRAGVRVARLVGPAEPAQQLAACRVEVAVLVKLDALDDREAGLGPLGLRDRDRAAELH